MLFKGMAMAAALIAGAAVTLELTSGEAAVSQPGGLHMDAASPRGPLSLGKAPLSLGNASTAAALASLNADRFSMSSGADATQDNPAVPQPYTKAFNVRSGDTLGRILNRAGADAKTADTAIRALKGVFDPRSLKAGQTLEVAYAPTMTGDGHDRFIGFDIPLDYATRVNVSAAPEGGFRAVEIERELQTQQVRAEGTISWRNLPACSARLTLFLATSPISCVATWLRSASLRTSAATTAKPLPCSPARAASIAAFSASKLVW